MVHGAQILKGLKMFENCAMRMHLIVLYDRRPVWGSQDELSVSKKPETNALAFAGMLWVMI